MYLFPQFFENKAVEQLLGKGIKVEHLNDDKIGRVMDKLFCEGLSEIFVDIVLKAIKKYQISTKQAHLDASSMCLSGQYKNQPERLENNPELESIPQPIQIVKGYSRDHRPDLKQFVINLICSNDGDIPLYFEGGDGNQSDKAKFTAIAKRFKKQVQFESILVADSALYSLQNINNLGAMSWLTRVPLSIKAAKELVREISSSELVKSELDGYSWCVKESNYGGIAQRWLVVESAARKESDQEKLKKNINFEYREKTQKLKEICRSKYEHQSCLNQALKSLEKSLKYHHLSEIEIKEVTSSSSRKPENNKPQITQYKLSATLVKDLEGRQVAQK
jgi:transposase